MNIARIPASGPAALQYWNTKATSYPTLAHAQAAARATRLRQLAMKMGVSFDVPTILDLGCGTGIHALPMAELAGRVVAIDLSPEMLVPLRALAPPNLEIHALDWAESDLDARGWRGAFDLVWAIMTPAVGAPALLAKMEAASRGLCCAMVWGAQRHDPLLSEAFALHGVEFVAPDWSAGIASYLKQQGRSFQFRSEPDRLRQTPTPAVLVEDLCAHLAWLGVSPDEQALATWAAARAHDGMILREVDFDLDVWVWRAQP
ncbi:MAG: PfkB-family carbohydrate kinase [Proteobacteria bacterium]|nr:PfkB-family carbohydrate kinase [Pseudomonadota bacterium]